MKLRVNKINQSQKQTNVIKFMPIFSAIFIIGITGMIVMLFFFNKATSTTLDVSTYQYFGDGKSEYSSGTAIENSKISNVILKGDESLGLDPTPLYSYDNLSMYLPKNYAYCSVQNNKYWRIPEFTKLIREEGINIVTCLSKNSDYQIEGGFLFDGGSNYVFLDDGTVIINDFEEYPVSSFSFFSKEYEITRIYNLINKEYSPLYTTITSAIYLSNSGYSVDLIKGIYISSSGNKTLLVASPEVLENIEESVENVKE